jgi:hypothetical protein
MLQVLRFDKGLKPFKKKFSWLKVSILFFIDILKSFTGRCRIPPPPKKNKKQTNKQKTYMSNRLRKQIVLKPFALNKKASEILNSPWYILSTCRRCSV